MKVCLVTVGATASFKKLIQEVLSGSFLAQLKRYNYTHIMVQYGKDAQPIFDKFLNENPEGSGNLHGIGIGGFDFVPDMTPYVMMAMENEAKDQEQGMMISHAGTGSILEGLRAGLPLVVVPNPDLADNHQEELALELEKLGYAVKTSVEDVVASVEKAEIKRRTPKPQAGADIGVSDAMSLQMSTLD